MNGTRCGAEWEGKDDPRPPVLIVVCKDTRLAKVVFEWIAEGATWPEVPAFGIESLGTMTERATPSAWIRRSSPRPTPAARRATTNGGCV